MHPLQYGSHARLHHDPESSSLGNAGLTLAARHPVLQISQIGPVFYVHSFLPLDIHSNAAQRRGSVHLCAAHPVSLRVRRIERVLLLRSVQIGHYTALVVFVALLFHLSPHLLQRRDIYVYLADHVADFRAGYDAFLDSVRYTIHIPAVD